MKTEETQTAFTASPWRAYFSEEESIIIGTLVAAVDMNQRFSHETVATTPELYEALKIAEQSYVNLINVGRDEFHSALSIVRAALHKVEAKAKIDGFLNGYRRDEPERAEMIRRYIQEMKDGYDQHIAELVSALERVSNCWEMEPHGGNPLLKGMDSMKDFKRALNNARALIDKYRKK